jgi:hypothetical protein
MRMKRIILYLLAFAPLAAFAQLTSSGYYRVQSAYTNRYISIVDTRASITASATSAGHVNADLDAFYMLRGFEEKVSFNPATICYVEVISDHSCNIKGQDLDLYEKTGYLLSFANRPNDLNYPGCYWLYAVYSGATKYLNDNDLYEDYGYEKVFHPSLDGTAKTRCWWIKPVDQNDCYFGVKPEITASADGSYWSTMYADFPFRTSAETTKVYTVTKVDNERGFAVIEEVSGDIPVKTPVLFRCSGANPSDNKLTLLSSSTTGNVGTNYLGGNYYCNDVQGTHRNVVAYNAKSMRMLGTTGAGKPAFVKSNISYLPANKCFLVVGASTPDTLEIITKEQYEAGTKAEGKTTFSEKVKETTDLSGTTIDDTYYTLSAANGDGYSAEEQGIVLNSTTSAEQMDIVENAEIGDAAVKDNFKGVIFKVPAGTGFVTVDVKTKGTHFLNVQVGKNEPKKLTKSERGLVQVEFNVTQPTYVYLYASAGSANSAPHRAAAENSVLLYSYDIKFASTTGIETINANVAPVVNKTGYYDLSGRKLPGKPSAKGIYIVNGKKIVIK